MPQPEQDRQEDKKKKLSSEKRYSKVIWQTEPTKPNIATRAEGLVLLEIKGSKPEKSESKADPDTDESSKKEKRVEDCRKLLLNSEKRIETFSSLLKRYAHEIAEIVQQPGATLDSLKSFLQEKPIKKY